MTEDLVPYTTQGTNGMADIVAGGGALQRAQAGFVTAVTVQRPRDRKQVMAACEEEATIAGDQFLYAWTVSGKDGKKSLVEGPSVDLALAAVRNWGNCGVLVNVDEKADVYVFIATFIDLETGFNLQRAFRQKKERNLGERMRKDEGRAEDIVFQIGQSKAIRNVIVNGLPSWLTSAMMAKAKENVVARIQKKGVAAAREDTLKFFGERGISQDRIEAKVGKKATAWTVEDLARLHGAVRALIDGQEAADDLFPPLTAPPPRYDVPDELLKEIAEHAQALGYNEAKVGMLLGQYRGQERELLDELHALVAAKSKQPEAAKGEAAPLFTPESEASPSEAVEKADVLAKIIAWKKKDDKKLKAVLAQYPNYLQASAETLKEILGKLEAGA